MIKVFDYSDLLLKYKEQKSVSQINLKLLALLWLDGVWFMNMNSDHMWRICFKLIKIQSKGPEVFLRPLCSLLSVSLRMVILSFRADWSGEELWGSQEEMAERRAGAEEVQRAAGEVRRGQSCSGSETETCSEPAWCGDEKTLQDGSRLPLPGECPAVGFHITPQNV